MKLNITTIKKFYFAKKGTIKNKLFKLGENDHYPQFTKPKYSILTTSQRFEFWNYLAKKNRAFSHFYEKNPEDHFLKYTDLKKNNIYFNVLKEFYKNGIAEVKNFFNEADHKLIKSHFDSTTVKDLDLKKRSTFLCQNDLVNNTIHHQIKNIEEIIFGKFQKVQDYTFESIKKIKNEISPVTTSSSWHMDRFIPCIKLMYCPTKVMIDPFEYALKSHIIDKQFFQNIRQIIDNQSYLNNEKNINKISEINNEKFPDIQKLNEIENILNYKINFDNFEKKKFYCDENSLLIIAVHGLHRRSQTKELEIEGIRNNCTVGYANQYSRYDLLRLFLKKNLYKKQII